MNPVFLSIGSNVAPSRNIPECLKLLRENFTVLKISPAYETDPVGPAGEKKFWNLAASLDCGLEKKELVEKLREIEASLGRRREAGNKFAPREIDIDILPQPGYQDHAFIMIPLAEIAPQAQDAETGKTFQELAAALAPGTARSMRKVLPGRAD